MFYSLPEELVIKIITMNPHPVADVFKVEKNKFNINSKYDSAGSYLECYSKKHMCYGYYSHIATKFSTFSELFFDAIKLEIALRRFRQKNKLTKHTPQHTHPNKH